MDTNNKKYSLTLTFDGFDELACMASMYQVFQVQYGDKVDICDIRQLPENLAFFIDMVSERILKDDFVSIDDQEEWDSLSEKLVRFSNQIQGQIINLPNVVKARN
jgi:hypothetical protein